MNACCTSCQIGGPCETGSVVRYQQAAIGDLVQQLQSAIEQKDWGTVLAISMQLVMQGVATIAGNGNIIVNGTEIDGQTGQVVGGSDNVDVTAPKGDPMLMYIALGLAAVVLLRG